MVMTYSKTSLIRYGVITIIAIIIIIIIIIIIYSYYILV
jgi:hypothetical protein